MSHVKVLQWRDAERGYLQLLDQTQLPEQVRYLDCYSPQDVWHAIRQLSVRGAPAIGIAAAYGVVLSLRQGSDQHSVSLEESLQHIEQSIAKLATSRPTAVNLFWALKRMSQVAASFVAHDPPPSAAALRERLLHEAHLIHHEDIEMCRRIGAHGSKLFREVQGVLTHCNAGALATGGGGTALAPLYAAHQLGVAFEVYADETRPLLQGARLTAWELAQAGIPVRVICDNMAATVLRSGKVQAVIVGADRITRRGDVANKIGTYGLAILARYHRIPFYVAAPSSTFDLELLTGAEIEIEERNAAEIAFANGKRVVPEGVEVYNPAFDYTPAELITAIITEKGIIEPINEASVMAQMGS